MFLRLTVRERRDVFPKNRNQCKPVKTNENGVRLMEFAMEGGLVIKCTHFKHKVFIWEHE